METLSLNFSPINALNLAQRRRRCNYLTGSALVPIPTGPSFPSPRIRHNCRGVTRMQVVEEEYEVKQMKDMAAARKRWEALVRDGKVKVLTPREAGYAIQLSNKALLDVRPSNERKKAWVKGSTWVPIFDVDESFDAGTLSRKITGFMMGGWWSGIPILSYDKQFLSKVAEKFPKDTDLIVTCQKGLRSLAACELLHNAGYENIFWIQGGLEAADGEDLEREGPQPFKLAGIGGLSEFLGWTDPQRAQAAKEGWGYRLVFSARLVGLFLVADALFIGSLQVRDGKVKVLTPREAGFAIQLSNKALLDVRPSNERKKAWVKGSTWVPIFDVDESFDAGTLSRKITGFMMGGWWSGIPTLSYDKQFLSKVAEKFPKDTDLIVTCQKGLRSLAACELLHNAGYENIFWIQGGLEAADGEDLEREGPQPFKLAGIGGLSEFLG